MAKRNGKLTALNVPTTWSCTSFFVHPTYNRIYCCQAYVIPWTRKWKCWSLASAFLLISCQRKNIALKWPGAVKHEKLNEKFNCLDLRNEDKMCYLIQGLRADIQAEVLKKGEDTARLIYSIQQSTLQRKEGDVSRIVQAVSCVPSTTDAGAAPEIQGALARIQHQHDNVMSTMVKTPSMSEAAVNAYQYSPQDPRSFMIKCHVLNKECNKFSVWLETGLKKIQGLKLLLTSQPLCNQQMKNWDICENKLAS